MRPIKNAALAAFFIGQLVWILLFAFQHFAIFGSIHSLF